jgi:16S rRNA (uracil1498-N3)-methyltransferase
MHSMNAGGSGCGKRCGVLPRFHIGAGAVLVSGQACALPEGVSRHIQVLRMQPGGQVQLFDGLGGEWLATVTSMGRKLVEVVLQDALVVDRELPVQVTLALGMPANDRMDALVEKAAELGVHAVQPLVCERSVLRLDGERAAKKVAHWQAVAVSACEQSGRAVVPVVLGVRGLASWLREQAAAGAGRGLHRGVLSLREAISIGDWLDRVASPGPVARGNGRPDGDGGVAEVPSAGHGAGQEGFVFLSGPEGGLSVAEEDAALAGGWTAVSLGRRVLRADTAPLAALSVIGARYEQGLAG